MCQNLLRKLLVNFILSLDISFTSSSIKKINPFDIDIFLKSLEIIYFMTNFVHRNSYPLEGQKSYNNCNQCSKKGEKNERDLWFKVGILKNIFKNQYD